MVQNWLRASGFNVTHTPANRHFVAAEQKRLRDSHVVPREFVLKLRRLPAILLKSGAERLGRFLPAHLEFAGWNRYQVHADGVALDLRSLRLCQRRAAAENQRPRQQPAP